MKPTDPVPFGEQRRALRERMQSQRVLIAKQLGPVPEPGGAYPRSKTMRFLVRHPDFAVTVLAEIVALLAGARHAKAVTAVTALSRIVRSAGNGARHPRSGQMRI